MAALPFRVTARVTDAGGQRLVVKLRAAMAPPAIAGWMQSSVTTILRVRAAERFSEEGDSASGKWAQLSPVTVKIRQAMGVGGAHPINVRSGGLRAFVIGANADIASSEGGVLFNWPDTPPKGKLSDKLDTAQHGNARAPARPVIAVDETDAELIAKSLALHIRAIMGSGRKGGLGPGFKGIL